MEAISSEIALKMTRDDFSCFIGFKNFPGENHQPPPSSRLENMWSIFQSKTAQHKSLLQRGFQN